MKKEIKGFNHEKQEFWETNHEISKILTRKDKLKEKIEGIKVTVSNFE